MNKIKAVLFDIDGTLLDTFEFVFSAVRYTLEKHRLSASEELIIASAGKPLVEYYKAILPYENFEELAQTHRDYQEDKHDLAKPFPGVKEVLQTLKKRGLKIAGVSNRSKESLVKSLKLAGLYQYFDAIVSAEEVENPKPHPEHLLKALALLGVEKKSALMVGDTEKDILAGRGAQVKTAGVTYGWIGTEINKSNPDYVIEKIEDLLKIL